MENNDKYNELRRRHPWFDYEGYSYAVGEEGLTLRFDFRMDGVEFHPTATIERREWLDFGFDAAEMDRWVFETGMVELVSYWKCACAPVVRVKCGTLDAGAVAFWKKLYWNGLGEFFFTNSIAATMDDFMSIEAEGSAPVGNRPPGAAAVPAGGSPGTDYLVPVGGGKDSVVTLELLRRAGKRVRPLIMNPRGATRECARVAGFGMDEVLVIRRSIDPQLLELNRQGYLNGHTPFSAMLAFYTRIASALAGVANVALSNESSANESTVAGTTVNHQYSKSLEFEDDFRRYACNERFRYFSFLRPLSELQIAMLFSRLEAYHGVFRSCNVGSKRDEWCGRCAKCLFAYIILSPFVPPQRLSAMFGKPMLDDGSLRLEMEQLAGMAPTKPFECVGTVAEVRQALAMADRRWYAGGRPALMQGLPFLDAPVAEADLERVCPRGNLTEGEWHLLKKACSEKRD